MATKKLYELLAIVGQLNGQATATRTELAATFTKKKHLFEKKIVTFQSNEENAAAVTEAQSEIQSTVSKELAWISGILTKAIDAGHAVAEGNTSARANIILDNGTILLSGLPATALLEMEKRATEIQALVDTIPTLDPAKSFTPDTTQGAGISVAREVSKTRTKKSQRVITLAPATEHHAAQAQLVSEDVETGKVTEREWSGMFTPAQKGDMLERCEELRRAIKAALQRANEVEIKADLPSAGTAIFAFVLGTKAAATK